MKQVNQLDVAQEIEKKIGEEERLRVRLVLVNYYHTIILNRYKIVYNVYCKLNVKWFVPK